MHRHVANLSHKRFLICYKSQKTTVTVVLLLEANKMCGLYYKNTVHMSAKKPRSRIFFHLVYLVISC